MAERTCSIDGCDQTADPHKGGARGWCTTHYMRWRRHGDPNHGGPVIRQSTTGMPCPIVGCVKLTVARDLCENHYRRWKRYGDPLAGKTSPGLPTDERFWSKVDKTAECWNWTDAPNGAGYGTFSVNSLPMMAHRYSWTIAGNTLDPLLELDHLCRNRLCVNPAHLEPVTTAENLRRAREAATRESMGGGRTGV